MMLAKELSVGDFIIGRGNVWAGVIVSIERSIMGDYILHVLPAWDNCCLKIEHGLAPFGCSGRENINAWMTKLT